MADEELLEKVQSLDDLDLAALLCLINREHCIISTESTAVDELVEELQLVASETFSLRSAVVSLTPQTTLDDFAASILLPPPASSRSSSPLQRRRTSIAAQDSYFHPSAHAYPQHQGNSPNAHRTLSPLTQISPTSAHYGSQTGATQIANVILARDLDRAPKAVQIQALELLRTRRIFTRTSVQLAPKQFLFIAVLGAPSANDIGGKLTQHLNDFFYLSHWHDPLDGFARLDEREGAIAGSDQAISGDEDDASINSTSSVVRRRSSGRTTGTPTPRTELFPPYSPDPIRPTGQAVIPSSSATAAAAAAAVAPIPILSESDLTTLSLASGSVAVDVDVLRYQLNLIAFLRLHPAAASPGSVPATATQHLGTLVRSLAALHGLDYVTPALVALALRKVYLHRIRVLQDPRRERSMQWGSEAAAVKMMLEGVGPEEIMDDILEAVEVPL